MLSVKDQFSSPLSDESKKHNATFARVSGFPLILARIKDDDREPQLKDPELQRDLQVLNLLLSITTGLKFTSGV